MGSALVRRLVENKVPVRVLDNNWRGAKDKLSDVWSQLEYVEADIRDEKAVVKACQGVDVVCHLAYINGTEYFYSMPEFVLDVAVVGMTNILKGAIAGRVKEFILASSSEVCRKYRRAR